MIIDIQEATLQDAEVISNIHALSWKVAYKGIIPQLYLDELQNDFWVALFRNWIGNNMLHVKLIYEDNLPVGCIAYGKSRDEKLPTWGEIASIYIHPEYINKGYGQKLLNVALADMKKEGYHNCYLWVIKENKSARLFYEKNGFQDNKDEYIFEIMKKQLIDTRYITNLANYG